MARPRLGTRGLAFRRECLAIGFALTAVAHSGGDDSTRDISATLTPIGVDDGEKDPIGDPKRDNPLLPVVLAVVVSLQRRTIKDERGKKKSNPRSARLASPFKGSQLKRTGKYTSVYTPGQAFGRVQRGITG